MTALGAKSWKDLRRRPARSAFTIASISFAVAGLWIFAMPVLMGDAMNHRIAQDRLHDVRLPTLDVVLSPDDLASLRRVPGVRALSARTIYDTRIVEGDRRRDVLLVGVSDWPSQPVNAVTVDSGRQPEGAQVVTDPMNGRTGRFGGKTGDTVDLEAASGGTRPLQVVGRGDTLLFSQIVADEKAVLYAPQSTVNALAGAKGVNSIEFRVDDPARADAVLTSVRARLLEMRPNLTFPDLADVRPTGSWPGQESFDNFSTLLYVGALLALVSALVLISNTMTTMVAEQSREIAIMKAIGGRRRQIRRTFLRTALALGAIGTVLGIALGIPFANLVLGFIGTRFFGIDPEWGVPVNAVVISVVVGIGVTMLAALPALRRAARTSVRTGLEGELASGGDTRLDRVLRRVPLPRNAMIGLRNVSRRRTRTFTTMLQVALAVSVALGFLALGVTIGDVTAKTWDTMKWDVIVSQRSNAALDAEAGRVVASTPGVAASQPVLYNTLKFRDGQYEAWGLPPSSTLYTPAITSGRWLREADADSGKVVTVIGRALASKTGTKVGDVLQVGTARGTASVEVVGIDKNLMNNGTTLYLPLSSFQRLLGRTDTNAYWVVSASQDERAIDRLATTLEQRLGSSGYPVSTSLHYVEKNANLDGNRVLVAVLAAISVPIVFIGMVGLLNAMTMNVIERTRDVGVLRCIGASAGSVRRIFRTEALTVAFAGAVLGILGGWVVGWVLGRLVTSLFHFGSVPYTFPLASALLGVLVTLALAWLVVIAPLRRASHLRPGDALRYE